MSDHDVMMSKFIALREVVAKYVETYDPLCGETCLELLSKAMIKANNFVEEPWNQKTS